MPELPEVESLRLALEPHLVGRRVELVRVRTRSVVAMPADPVAGFARSRRDATPARLELRLLLQGCTITRLARRGKQLAIVSAEGPALGVQLGMTGGLSRAHKPQPHTHVVWTLDDGSRLAFVDPRRFGLVAAHESFQSLQDARWASLGPDALTVTPRQLRHACEGSQRSIKALLLDQQALAGVGNIYADESLFTSRIHPATLAADLDDAAIRALARSIRQTLRAAIDAGGSTIRDYRSPAGSPGGFQHRHQVYARAGKPCLRCGTPLARTVLAQRSTVFCPVCQPAPT